METGLHIGHKVDREAIDARAQAILQILSANADQKTIRQALRVLEKATSLPEISETTIRDCSFSSYDPTSSCARKEGAEDDDPEAFE